MLCVEPFSINEELPINNSVPLYSQQNETDDQRQSDDQDDSEKEGVRGYRNLISIHAGKPKGGFENWFADHGHVRRLSLSEQELEDIISTKFGTDIVR